MNLVRLPEPPGCQYTAACVMQRSEAPPFLVRLLFWLILGAFSVFFAEVTAGSSPFPWIDAWGLFVVLPLYGLHVLFLAWIVVPRARRISLPTLFVAGALFGMYEAYITKVLFDPS